MNKYDCVEIAIVSRETLGAVGNAVEFSGGEIQPKVYEPKK